MTMNSYAEWLKSLHPENLEYENEMITRVLTEMCCMNTDMDILFWNVIQYAVKHDHDPENLITKELLDGVFNREDEITIYKILEGETK